MRAFGRYFWYRIKSTSLRLAALAAIATLLSSLFVFVYQTIEGKEWDYYSGSCTWLGISACILAVVLPMLELLGLKNRRNLDTLLFMPINSGKMLAVRLFNGFLQLVITTAASFLMAAAKIGVMDNADKRISDIAEFYFVLIAHAAIIYIVVSFAIFVANNAFDGVVFALGYSFIFANVAEALMQTFGQSKLGYSQEFLLYAPLARVTKIYDRTVFFDYKRSHMQWVQENLEYFKGKYCYESLYLWICVAVCMAIALVFLGARLKSHKMGEISDSIFGYKSLIPFYAITSVFSMDTGNPSTKFIIVIVAYIGYAVYRRGIKLRLSDYLWIGLIFATIVCDIVFL